MTTTITFTTRPTPPLSEADRRRVATWVRLALPSFRDLSIDAAMDAAARLVSEVWAFAGLAGRKDSEILAGLFSLAVAEQAAGAAARAALEPDEGATVAELGQAVEGLMASPEATPADAVQLFVTPLTPADHAFLVGKVTAALEPDYHAGRLLPRQAREFERLRKRLHVLAGADA
jgi:hypothetical protein